jgi:hypothetical protein
MVNPLRKLLFFLGYNIRFEFLGNYSWVVVFVIVCNTFNVFMDN